MEEPEQEPLSSTRDKHVFGESHQKVLELMVNNYSMLMVYFVTAYKILIAAFFANMFTAFFVTAYNTLAAFFAATDNMLVEMVPELDPELAEWEEVCTRMADNLSNRIDAFNDLINQTDNAFSQQIYT